MAAATFRSIFLEQSGCEARQAKTIFTAGGDDRFFGHISALVADEKSVFVVVEETLVDAHHNSSRSQMLWQDQTINNVVVTTDQFDFILIAIIYCYSTYRMPFY